MGAASRRDRPPAVYPFRYYVQVGGLISYGVDVADLFRRAAGYVDRILRGEKPGNLPVQQPTKFELVVNLKTAQAIGLTIPHLHASVVVSSRDEPSNDQLLKEAGEP